MKKDYSVEEEMNEDQKKETKRFKLFGNSTSERESKETLNKNWIQKIGIKNLCLLLFLGIILIILCYQSASNNKKEKTDQTDDVKQASQSLDSNPIYTKTASETEDYVTNLEKKLKDILSKVNGIGRVEVMITLAESKELVTLKDKPYTQDSVNENDGEGGSRISDSITREDETVMSTTVDGATTPYIIKEIQPSIEGVLVLAEGMNDPELEVDIVEAVEALFDVPIHKIKVMQMENR